MLLQSTICVVTGKAIEIEETDNPNEYPFVVEIYEHKDATPTIYKLGASRSKTGKFPNLCKTIVSMDILCTK